MANLFSGWFSSENPCRNFQTNEHLFEGLARLETAAIVCIQEKTEPPIRKIVLGFGLPAEKTEEILNQATLIFLQKIGSGGYEFRGHAPASFLIEIAKNLARMATRSQRRTPDSIENHLSLEDASSENFSKNLENIDLVRNLLTALGEPCATVIRLHHIDGLSDEEVVNQRLTKYSTPDSLKVKRSDCMKKLIELSKKWTISRNI